MIPKSNLQHASQSSKSAHGVELWPAAVPSPEAGRSAAEVARPYSIAGGKRADMWAMCRTASRKRAQRHALERPATVGQCWGVCENRKKKINSREKAKTATEGAKRPAEGVEPDSTGGVQPACHPFLLLLAAARNCRSAAPAGAKFHDVAWRKKPHKHRPRHHIDGVVQRLP
jgi:hypothetical protein